MSKQISWPARLRQSAFNLYFRATRSMTLGVRALVLRDDHVWLVRHTYVDGWYLPGGGVERGETVRQALEKELREEGNIALIGEPEHVACMANFTTTDRDHVCYFIVRQFEQTVPYPPNREIAEGGWFPVTALPDGTTRATRARVTEFLSGGETPANW